MLRQILLVSAVTCVFTAPADALQQDGGGQNTGQGTATQRSQKTLPGPPGQPPDPDPMPSGNIWIRGQIIAPATRDFPAIQVRVETSGGQPVGVAFVNSTR